MSPRILLIEDDTEIHSVVSAAAHEIGCQVEIAADGRSGLARATSEQFSMVILDLGLPDVGGMDVCRRIRESFPAMPLIMLTSKSDELTKVLGFEAGADDYVTKPFSSPELIARIRALLRRVYRAPASQSPDVLRVGEFKIDLKRRQLKRNGQNVPVTRVEFDLFLYLAERLGRVVNRNELIENVWGYRSNGYDGTITTSMGRLRMKIERNPAAPEYLLTIRGVGYRLIDPTTEAQAILEV